MYEQFGENQKNLIVLIIVISSRDTKQSMISAYQRRAGITPTFPIVLYRDGASDMAKLFTSPNAGGPTWICHPKRTYDRTSYREPQMSRDIRAALNTTNIHSKHSHDCSFGVFVFTNKLCIKMESEEKLAINVFNAFGRNVFNTFNTFSHGFNTIDLNNKTVPGSLSRGLYIIDIQGESGLHYKKSIMLK